jgi:hypothetical protein
MANFPFSLKGTTLNYVLPDYKIARLEPADRVYPLDGTDYTLTFSTNEQSTMRQASHRVGMKTPDQIIEARFFDYIQRYITICRTGKSGFLSGPFSGCWLIRFFMSGAYYAAHIGTNLNQGESAQVKKAFTKYTERTIMHSYSCFNPHRVWTDDERLELGGGKNFYNLAYINPEGKCYSIFLVKKDVSQVKLTTKVTSRFPAHIEGKLGWKPQDMNAKKELFVSHSFEVKEVREVTSRTWADVKASEAGFL